MTKPKQWALGVSGTVVAGIISFLLVMWWGHFEATAQTARSQAETEEIQEKVVDSQAKIVEAVEKLTEIHEDADVARKQTKKLCQSGEIARCQTCLDVGVYDTEACEKLDAKRDK